MNQKQKTPYPGFTLIEILIVVAILFGLIALLLPAMMARQERVRISQVNIKLRQFENDLELYATENRGYPTTEQGLMVFLYIPDNLGLASPMTQPPGLAQGTLPGAAPSAFGMGDATVTGPEMLGNAVPGGAMPGVTNPATVGNAPGMTMPGLSDPTMMGMGVGVTGGAMTAWNQPVYNPALYTQKRRRPQPYIESDRDLLDPWGTPYRYENNLQYYGVNRTGTAKPAIWSAGPNKLDFDDDDICNWDALEAQQLIAQRQQMGAGMTGGALGGPMGMDPMNPAGAAMAPVGMQNMQPPMQQPMQPGGAMPNSMMSQPMSQPMPQPGAPNPMPTQSMAAPTGNMPMQPPMQSPMPTPMPTPMPGAPTASGPAPIPTAPM